MKKIGFIAVFFCLMVSYQDGYALKIHQYKGWVDKKKNFKIYKMKLTASHYLFIYKWKNKRLHLTCKTSPIIYMAVFRNPDNIITYETEYKGEVISLKDIRRNKRGLVYLFAIPYQQFEAYKKKINFGKKSVKDMGKTLSNTLQLELHDQSTDFTLILSISKKKIKKKPAKEKTKPAKEAKSKPAKESNSETVDPPPSEPTNDPPPEPADVNSSSGSNGNNSKFNQEERHELPIHY